MNILFIRPVIAVSLVVAIVVGCNSKSNKVTQKDTQRIQEQLIDAHKGLLKKDADSIKNFAKSKNWAMTQTQTGLWYEIVNIGTGSIVELGDIVQIDYRIELLDGTLCYKSDSLTPKEFKVGQGGVESGLEEGILKLRKGDKARFIMPPHLAYGVIGDQHKIPRMAIIKYDVEVLDVRKIRK